MYIAYICSIRGRIELPAAYLSIFIRRQECGQTPVSGKLGSLADYNQNTLPEAAEYYILKLYMA
jgi:hypothetical protein